MTAPAEYFERKRGYWNFVSSLVVGIVAGSLLGVTVGRIFGTSLPSPYDAYVDLVVAPVIAGGLIYFAVRLSAGLETTTKVYELVVNPKSFSSVVNPILLELSKTSRGIEGKELHEKLTSINGVLGSKEGMTVANLQSLRKFRTDVTALEGTWRGQDILIGEMLSKLSAMLSTLESLPTAVVGVCGEQSELVFRGRNLHFKVSKGNKSRITAKKGSFMTRRTMFWIEFGDNIDNSLLTPSTCTITTYPLADFLEHHKFEGTIHYLLNTIKSRKTFQELGLEFSDLGDLEYWATMKQTIVEPVLKQIQEFEQRFPDSIQQTKEEH